MTRRNRIDVVAKWLGRHGCHTMFTESDRCGDLAGTTLGGRVYAFGSGALATDGGALYWCPVPTDGPVFPANGAARQYVELCTGHKRMRPVPRWPDDLVQRDVRIGNTHFDSRYLVLARYLLGRDAEFATVRRPEAMDHSLMSSKLRLLLVRSDRGVAAIMPLRRSTREVIRW